MRKFLLAAAFLFCSASLSAQVSQTPTFAALDMDGKKVDIAELRGKVVVINLWFINCPNCVEEIKLLNGIVDQYKDNTNVAFISLAASKKADLVKFLQKNPFRYKTIPDAGMIILSKFGTPDNSGEIKLPFPMHFILDREGKIIMKEQGIKGVDVVKSVLKKQFPA